MKYTDIWEFVKTNMLCKMNIMQLAISSALLCTLMADSGIAQQGTNNNLCVSTAVGVPGYEGAPQWYDSSNTATYWEKIDDPRWNSSTGVSYGRGAGEEMTFRALTANESGGEYLYLFWYVKVDPYGMTSLNRLYLGFQNSSKDKMIVLQFIPTPSGLINKPQDSFTNTGQVVSMSTTSRTSQAWGNWIDISENNQPDWTKVSKKYVAVLWSQQQQQQQQQPSTNKYWAICMRIPVNNIDGSSFKLGKNFKMKFQLTLTSFSSPGSISTSKHFKLPESSQQTLSNTSITAPGTSDVYYKNGFVGKYDSQDEWMDINLQSTSKCNYGVSLAQNDIGTKNKISFNSVNQGFFGFSAISEVCSTPVGIPAPHRICYPTQSNTTPVTNVFFANLLNNTGQEIKKNTIQARFRIANWGSAITWTDIDSNKKWVSNSNNIANGQKGEITLAWTLPAKPTINPHQCILVELSAVSSSATGSIRFLNDSAYRNMDFVRASKFKRQAEIAIAGLSLANIVTTHRDVYLYVQTLNMPAFIPLPNQTSSSGKVPDKNPRQAIGSAQVARMVESGQYNGDNYDKIMPTYRVFVYHDTGKRETIDGKIYQIVESQPSFGYYVAHDGEIEGWRHKLEGAEEIAPNFYRLRIPNNGKAIVTTIIEAREVKKGGKIALNIRGGGNIPHGKFDAVYDPGFYLAGAVEYSVKENFSLEGLFGYNRFTGGSLCLKGVPGCTQSIRAADLNLYNFSLNGKYYFTKAKTRPFINLGGGLYKFDLSSARVGGNVGIGFQQSISPRFAVEVGYNIHNVATPVSATRFSTIQFGIRVRP